MEDGGDHKEHARYTGWEVTEKLYSHKTRGVGSNGRDFEIREK